jgi:ubiquinone/menaquinone biosynthesis C-methylase UbiE
MNLANRDPKFAYDRWHERMDGSAKDNNPLAFPWYRTAFNGIQKDLRGDLLELGCGRGEFAVWLACTVPGIRVTGVDFSVSAIAIAQKRISSASEAVRFITGDVQSLAFADNTFDWIVSCECLEHLPQPQMMAGEIFRVLKPGGRFCVTTENYLNGMFLAWIQSWVTRRPFNSGSGVQPIEQFFVFPQVKGYLRRAGLVVERTESTHYQWLLLPGVDPARLCTRQFNASWARTLAKPFGRRFSFFGYKPKVGSD